MEPIYIKNFLPQQLNDVLYNYCLLKYSDPQHIKIDQQANSLICTYNDLAMETILALSTPVIEKNVGKKLWPVNSFLRIYDKGSDLPIHLDRDACEYTVALCIGCSPTDKPYKIFVGSHDENSSYKYYNQDKKYISMKVKHEIPHLPNEAIIFKGHDAYHWREYCEHDHFISVFLHYVDQDGPFAEYKWDKREGLGRNLPSYRIT